MTTPLSDALVKYLDLTSDQLKLTAGNAANVDTPGYHTLGINFQDEFSRALQQGVTAGVTPTTDPVNGLVERPDGNNVSLDREGLQMAKEQLQFRTGVELLKNEYTRVMDAIHVDK
ncbi:MAG: flagellar basal body rod protein FlgB [Acidobacteriaceae bacterium]